MAAAAIRPDTFRPAFFMPSLVATATSDRASTTASTTSSTSTTPSSSPTGSPRAWARGGTPPIATRPKRSRACSLSRVLQAARRGPWQREGRSGYGWPLPCEVTLSFLVWRGSLQVSLAVGESHKSTQRFSWGRSRDACKRFCEVSRPAARDSPLMEAPLKAWFAAACLVSTVACSNGSDPNAGPTGGTGNPGSGATSGVGGTGGATPGTGGAGSASGGTGGTISGSGGSNDGVGGSSGGTLGGYELRVVAWPSDACVSQASMLVSQMSLEQKAAQMVMGQYQDVTSAHVSGEEVGTVFASGSAITGSGSAADWASLIDGYISASQSTPNGLPILFGIDAVHGNSKATGTVIFPHNIGLGSTHNPELVERIGQITALEMMATGASWTFGPVFSVAHDKRWGRTYESYSEDPGDVALMGAAAVVGLQGRGGLGTGAPGVVACAKHFAGDGQATYGTSRKMPAGTDPGGLVDRADVQVDEATMRTYGINPYIPAIEAGLGSVMVADTSWNGVNMTGHEQLLTTILKGELGFAGFVSTDWDAVMPDQDGPGVVAAINAGVDMLMAANNWPAQRADIIAAAGNSISQERIDDAVRRVLTVKCEAGLFGWTRDPDLLSEVGSETHRAVGRQAVGESLVLLKHEGGVLPLAKGSNVWVVGSGADALERQTGGWTISWQNGGDMTEGTTILEGI